MSRSSSGRRAESAAVRNERRAVAAGASSTSIVRTNNAVFETRSCASFRERQPPLSERAVGAANGDRALLATPAERHLHAERFV